ncbi:MAG: methylenetetrahydrofolate reductase [Chloroflexi bacterium]|nr:methylenetetrahydrofolate reductase [Chloroflexota bacterium]
MATVSEMVARRPARPLIVCDFSPPRGPDRSALEQARGLEADFICVAYNPGKSVRADSAFLAAAIQREAGRDAIFNLAPRDMNKLALQSHLTGAALLGLQNVVVVQGDPFTERERAAVRPVAELKPTELIRSIKALNEGTDFKGQRLAAPTAFCVGAALDLGKGLEREAHLAFNKVQAGADFLLAQPIFQVSLVPAFHDQYRKAAGADLSCPVFWGLQMLEKGSLAFGEVPEAMKQDLERGRPGPEIALELLERFLAAGVRTVYLVPPIMRGGARDYEAAQRVLATVRRRD